jgi:hypothetical protein
MVSNGSVTAIAVGPRSISGMTQNRRIIQPLARAEKSDLPSCERMVGYSEATARISVTCRQPS